MNNKLFTHLANFVTISMKLYKHKACPYEELFIICMNIYDVVKRDQFQKSF